MEIFDHKHRQVLAAVARVERNQQAVRVNDAIFVGESLDGVRLCQRGRGGGQNYEKEKKANVDTKKFVQRLEDILDIL